MGLGTFATAASCQWLPYIAKQNRPSLGLYAGLIKQSLAEVSEIYGVGYFLTVLVTESNVHGVDDLEVTVKLLMQ